MTAGYTVNPRVLRVLQGENIPLPQLQDMVHRSAPYQTADTNRRFHDWLFMVEGTQVTLMRMIQGPAGYHWNKGKKKLNSLVRHVPCQGRGCHECGWNGAVYPRTQTA